ncbi:MAG: VOC family protein [Mycobacteriaceae bacterium]
MAIQRLNHAVLYVRNVQESVNFYTTLLGFRVTKTIGSQAAFLQAQASSNDHDLGLFQIGSKASASPAGRTSVGMYHLAWEVQTLTDLVELQEKLQAAGALIGGSDHGTTKSLYGQDPDGLEFEIVWLIPAELLTEKIRNAQATILPLNLAKEIDQYGGETLSGIGISSH